MGSRAPVCGCNPVLDGYDIVLDGWGRRDPSRGGERECVASTAPGELNRFCARPSKRTTKFRMAPALHRKDAIHKTEETEENVTLAGRGTEWNLKAKSTLLVSLSHSFRKALQSRAAGTI